MGKSIIMFSLCLKRICVQWVPAAALLSAMSIAWAGAQSLPPMPRDPEMMLKPLVDNRQYNPEPQPGNLLEGSVQKHMQPTSLTADPNQLSPKSSTGSTGTKMITGQVQTLQQAIISESGTVDWYGWYLSARDYLGRMGGLQCALGTPIKFYRNGRIEALTFSPVCQASVAGRVFPLPAKTKLDAIILPVRPGEGPPATPEEIYSRVNGGNGYR